MFAEEKPMLESDLEKALIEHIEDFLLELGRGFRSRTNWNYPMCR